VESCDASARPLRPRANRGRNGKSRLAALEEFASPYAGHGAIFGQPVLHRGDDLTGERKLRIGRCCTVSLRRLRSASDLGFECIERMFEVRESRFQISQFLRGDLDP
jgi:hypothetical protein